MKNEIDKIEHMRGGVYRITYNNKLVVINVTLDTLEREYERSLKEYTKIEERLRELKDLIFRISMKRTN